MIKKINGRWRVDIEPVKGRRFRRIFTTKSEALRFQAYTSSKYAENPAWLPTIDRRRLSDLIELWYTLHGQNLRDSIRRKSKLTALCSSLGNPVGAKIDSLKYLNYRSNRAQSGVSPKTLNNELGYIRAVFNELIQLGHLDYSNPLQSVKPLKYQQHDLSFLTDDQIIELLHSISDGCHNPHVYPIAVICLSTGARWSEAENTSIQTLRDNLITFTNTKNGKNRSVPIDKTLTKLLLSHWLKFGPFTGSITSFRRALARTSIKLPRGQSTHVLRHTFASHFIQKGGNVLTLQKILGHSSLAMTMRYAHLAPDHLTEAIRYNPLSFSTLFRH